ncbi:UbiA prenyltransferase [Gloeophyllum trabeum ATCC 11539]|uniref:UbiA prenyltransferase n=1 Tax=Gloeophyllum trabeum (strain ATCC 11539 / FP-39264 / Madison 617) TaxID=670483 RepID=S7PYM7_GLOTA|nr:UbiA prenyltransferase [Gloeophyllum trabeum ATCC 11539]EPQ52553.1 UbiA prenyltransferase [Gloeophyllum trabeum ATCC 11539]
MPVVPEKTSSSQPWWQPYWEISRMNHWPRGPAVIFWPCVWSLLFSRYGHAIQPGTLSRYMAAFMGGGTISHCAICTLNDICDVDFDRQVGAWPTHSRSHLPDRQIERCKTLPSGRISVSAASVFLVVQTAAFCAVLLTINREAWVTSCMPLHGFYPLMKRVTHWPQAWLGLSMAWGASTTWLMVRPHDYDSKAVWALTAGIAFWTVVMDTMYACQDRRDDIKVGIGSTAVLFGSWITPILSVFAALFVATLIYAGQETNQGQVYYTIAVGGTAGHLAWQLSTFNADDNDNCQTRFDSNGQIGYIVTAGLLGQMYIS